MICKRGVVLSFLVLVVGMFQSVFAETDIFLPEKVELERTVHFVSPGGEPVEVPPGPYILEAAEEGLKLFPFEGGEALLIQAKAATQEEKISEPVTESKSLEEDFHYLALMLPDGRTFEAIGSYSGVRTRGLFSDLMKEAMEEAKRKQAKAKAAGKARFRYMKPDLNRWVKYCDARHPDKKLKTCCSRRNGACKGRCKKSQYPNTAYETKSQCLQDCKNVHGTCVGKAVARSKSAPNQQEKKILAKAIATAYNRCKRINNLVDRNLCCIDRAIVGCDSPCEQAADPNSCSIECMNYRVESCNKKYSKSEAARILAKTPNLNWMNTYCSKKKNLKGRDKGACCNRMYNRDQASCDGLHPNPNVKDSGEVFETCMGNSFKARKICER